VKTLEWISTVIRVVVKASAMTWSIQAVFGCWERRMVSMDLILVFLERKLAFLVSSMGEILISRGQVVKGMVDTLLLVSALYSGRGLQNSAQGFF
jgi:hypothetical protein